jgi:hypothetical protein
VVLPWTRTTPVIRREFDDDSTRDGTPTRPVGGGAPKACRVPVVFRANSVRKARRISGIARAEVSADI